MDRRSPTVRAARETRQPPAPRLTAWAVLLASVVSVAPAGASSAPPPPRGSAPVQAYTPGGVAIGFSQLGGTFAQPVLVTHAGDGTGRRFVVEQSGRIWVVTAANTVLGTPLLDIRGLVSTGGERGLLGLVFHPDHERNRRFFVNYTDRNGDTVIAEYRTLTTNPNVAYYGSRRVILRIVQPYPNHNGGHMAFGPDTYLYIGTGDGGGGGDPDNRAQSTTTLLGKLLRIDINNSQHGRLYGVPPSNPYYGKPGWDEIWARGLRNPWRWSFDRTTNDLWIADVGQDRYEEIDVSRRAHGGGRGANYGWRVMEGAHCYNPPSGCNPTAYALPVMEYEHAAGRCSVTGGYVYRGTLYPALQGAYLFADFCSSEIWATAASSPGWFDHLATRPANITSFGEDEAGSLYITQTDGRVYRITATPA